MGQVWNCPGTSHVPRRRMPLPNSLDTVCADITTSHHLTLSTEREQNVQRHRREQKRHRPRDVTGCTLSHPFVEVKSSSRVRSCGQHSTMEHTSGSSTFPTQQPLLSHATSDSFADGASCTPRSSVPPATTKGWLLGDIDWTYMCKVPLSLPRTHLMRPDVVDCSRFPSIRRKAQRHRICVFAASVNSSRCC